MQRYQNNMKYRNDGVGISRKERFNSMNIVYKIMSGKSDEREVKKCKT